MAKRRALEAQLAAAEHGNTAKAATGAPQETARAGAKDEKEEEMGAATQLQAAFRGHSARKELAAAEELEAGGWEKQVTSKLD